MNFRPYTAADRQACIDAFMSNVPTFFALSELPDFEKWLDEQVSRMAAVAHHPTEQYYVVLKDNQVVGCGGYYIEPDYSKAGLTWGLLHSSFHKQGLGKDLYLHRIKAIQAICPTCIIRLDTTQHTYTFFEKWGFVVTKITPEFYAPGIHRYDMELHPPSPQ
jgi:predicted GNAT family N-acyltransferase